MMVEEIIRTGRSINPIGDQGAGRLGAALEHNTTLAQLELSNNDAIGDQGAGRLWAALEHNTALTELDLSDDHHRGSRSGEACGCSGAQHHSHGAPSERLDHS